MASEMTFARALVKPLVSGTSPLYHPILAFRSLRATFKTGKSLFGEEAYGKYAVFHDAHEFAKENNFTKKEKTQLNAALNSGVVEFMNVGSLKNPKSVFLMTAIEGNTISGFVVRTKTSEQFPERIDKEPRTFTFAGNAISLSPDHEDVVQKKLGVSLTSARKLKYWVAMISGAATGAVDNPFHMRFKVIFEQPCFG